MGLPATPPVQPIRAQTARGRPAGTAPYGPIRSRTAKYGPSPVRPHIFEMGSFWYYLHKHFEMGSFCHISSKWSMRPIRPTRPQTAPKQYGHISSKWARKFGKTLTFLMLAISKSTITYYFILFGFHGPPCDSPGPARTGPDGPGEAGGYGPVRAHTAPYRLAPKKDPPLNLKKRQKN